MNIYTPMEHIYAQQTENHEKRQAIACRRVSAGRALVVEAALSNLKTIATRCRLLAVITVMVLFGGVAWGQRALPYNYGFENNNLATEGWTTYSVGTGNSGEFGISTDAQHNSAYGFRFSSYYRDNSSYDQYLFSPQLNGTNGVIMTFWYKASSTSGTETFKVGYSTTNTTPSSFTWVDDLSTNSTTWTQSNEYSFPAGTRYVAIYYYSNYQYRLYVDDFNFSAPPSCPKPTNIYVSNTTANSATINWTAGGSETRWDIYYSTSNTAPTGSTTPTVSNTATKPYTITGLTAETTYYIWVRANCGGGDVSNWSNLCEALPSACKQAGSGNATDNYLPSYNYFNYSLSQQIYTPAEVGSAGTLTAIQFYNAGTEKTRTYDLYIVHTAKTSFTSNTDWIAVTAADRMFRGSVTMAANTWTTITLTTPFAYNGTSNLAIIMDDNTGDYTSSPHMACRVYNATNQAIYIYSDPTNYDPSNPSSYSGTRPSVKNQVKFCMESSSCPTEIYTRDDWNDFCDCVNDGHDYAGETVTLMNDVAGVANMAGTSSSTPFKGTFDGQGHTLTVAIIGNSTQGQAPFQYIQGATIKNLVVSGSVTASYGSYPHAAGLVGFAWSGTNTIQNCLIHTNVTNNSGTSQNSHIGGIVGHAKASTIVMEGCVYDGRLTGDHYKGGLIGWSDGGATINLTNCLFNGTVSNTTTGFHPIGCSVSGGNVHGFVNNSYYAATNEVEARLDDLAKAIVNGTTGKGKHAYTVTGDGCVTVDLEPPATTYNVSGIVAYSPGIRYVGANGTIYGGDGDNMNLVLGCTNGAVESYSADHGTLSGSELDGTNDPYTLTMDANNTVISAVESSCPIIEINNTTDWNKFCNCVNSGSDYSGLTVNLKADISVNTMAGDGSHPFRGTFKGNEHTITVTYTATDDGGTAPFHTIDGATFQDLHITGTISMGDHSFGAGLAAKCYGDVTITNCKSSVTINSTHNGDGSNGGFISVNYGQYPNGSNKTVTFNGCVFSGRLLGSNTNRNGGFVGYTKYETDGSGAHWAMVELNNCLFVPTEVTMSNVNSATFSRYNTANHSNRVTTNNSYYTQPFTTAAFAANETDGTGPQGKQAYTVRGIEGVTAVRTGEHTDYSVSGISAYTPGLVYNNTIYGGNGDNLSLSLSYGGVAHDGYVADHGTLSGTETDGTNDPYTLTMIADSTKIKVACPNSITNRAKWNTFCNCVNNGHDYYNETVTLDANLTGGQTVSTMAGTTDLTYSFRGTFDGQAHTLDVSISSSEQGAAPFRCIDGATIKDLKVTGTVTSTAHHASGLVGFCKDGGTNTIQNCLVSTNVTNDNPYNGDAGNNYMGGIIGHNKGATTSIIGCVYDGTLTSQGFKGGMIGFADPPYPYTATVYITVTDSYFAGSYSANGYGSPNFSPVAIRAGHSFTFDLTSSNFYYNTDAGAFSSNTYSFENNSNKATHGTPKHAYSVTGDGCVTVNLTPPSTTYNVSGIVAYSPGIRYVGANGTIYGGNGDNMNLLLGCNSGTVDNYEADYGTLSGTATSGSNDLYTLTMVDHNTIIYANVCKISYVLNDSYGDGWNGNAIKVIDIATGDELASWTITSGYGPVQGSIIVPNGSEIQFVWVPGSYASECSYTVSDRAGTIFSGSGAMNNTPYNHKACSSCKTPTNITITGITTSSAAIGWTENGSATSWVIEYSTNSDFSNSTSVTVSDNPHTLTGLTSGATYYVRVKAVCGVGDESARTPDTNFFVEDGCTTIGTAAGSNHRVPFYSDNTSYRSYVQMLYKASEMGSTCRGMITDIKFHYNSSDYNQPLKVYLGSTSQTTLATAWITDADLTPVYDGTVSFTRGWAKIELDEQYYWDGESNILVAVMTTNPVTESERIFYATASTGGSRGIYSTGEIIIDATNIPSVAGNKYDQRADIKFCIDCCTPRTGESGFDFCRDTLNLAIGSSGSITMPVEGADGVTPGGTVHYRSSNTSVATVDDNGTVTGVAEGTAIITARIDYDDPYCPVVARYRVKVGTEGMSEECSQIGNSTNYTSGSSGTYGGVFSYNNYYAYTQQLYTKDELEAGGACAGKVTKIVMHYKQDSDNAFTFDLFIGQTTNASLSSSWITDANLTLVHSGAYTFKSTSTHDGWDTIDISAANWSWDGSSNIVLAFHRTSKANPGGYNYPNFYHTNTSSMCRYTYNSSTDITLDVNHVATPSGSTTYQRPEVRICTQCEFVPDEMPTVEVTYATQESICVDDPMTNMVVTASNDVTFSPALSTLGLSYNTSTHTISGTPDFTGPQTVTVTTTSSDGCLKAEKVLSLTVVQCCTPRDGALEFCKDEVNITTGTADFTIPLTNTVNPSGTVNYTCEPAGVVTVNSTTGLVHPVAPGTATITATIPAETINGTDYCSKSASYTVNVGTPGTSEECDEIGNGTTDAQAPTQNAYKHCWSQMIYTHDEISHCSCGSIKKIIFNAKTTDPRPRTTKIYMGTTDASYFENTTSFIPANNMTLVWESSTSAVEGDVNNNGKWDIHAGENVFTLPTAFNYSNCNKNLVIAFYSFADNASYYNFYGTETTDTTVIFAEGDGEHGSTSDPRNYYESNSNLTGAGFAGLIKRTDKRPDVKICFNCDFTPTIFPSATLNPITQTVCKTGDVANAITDIVVTAVVPDGGSVTLTPSDKGLSYDSGTGKITGTPNFTGSQEFTLTVKDAENCLKDEKTFTVTVNSLNATIEFGD